MAFCLHYLAARVKSRMTYPDRVGVSWTKQWSPLCQLTGGGCPREVVQKAGHQRGEPEALASEKHQGRWASGSVVALFRGQRSRDRVQPPTDPVLLCLQKGPFLRYLYVHGCSVHMNGNSFSLLVSMALNVYFSFLLSEQACPPLCFPEMTSVSGAS